MNIETLNGWREDPVGILDDGQVGGDVQVGPAWSRRYIFGPVDGRYMLVTIYAYAADHDIPETDARHGTYAYDEHTEFLICTNLADPGGTELDSDYVYGEGGALCYDTVKAADHAARASIERDGLWTVQHYDPTDELRAGRIHR